MASYVAPEVREKFETLSINLKDYILERNVQINDIYDLINVLENILRKNNDLLYFSFPKSTHKGLIIPN